MPKYISDPKEFVKTLRNIIEQRDENPQKKNKSNEENNKTEKQSLNHSKVKFKNKIIIKHNKVGTKFKLRTRKYLYTTYLKDQTKIKDIIKRIPNHIEKEEIKRNGKTSKK